jgi:uncharacterized membrane protein
LIIGGAFQVIQSIAALANDEYLLVLPNYVFSIDLTGWGWIHQLLGAAIGAGIGALAGSMADVEIDDNFIDSVKQRVTPGTSALFLLSSDAVTDRVRGTFTDLNPELIAGNLSADREAKLRKVFTQE